MTALILNIMFFFVAAFFVLIFVIRHLSKAVKLQSGVIKNAGRHIALYNKTISGIKDAEDEANVQKAGLDGTADVDLVNRVNDLF